MTKLKTVLLTAYLLLSFAVVYSQEQIDPNKHVLLNKKVPVFTGKTLDGKNFSLLENRGKIILLHFWSFSCGVCYKEIPELNAISKAYGNKNVIVIALLKESREEALQKITVNDGRYTLKKKSWNNDKIDFQIIPGMKETINTFQVDEGFPKEFFIDEHGILREYSDGYIMSQYGNPTPEETENYKVLKMKVEKLLNAKK